MLQVLKFKKSLFAGVLDGGERDVFLGGTRLTRFMETVESVANSIPEATVEDLDAATHAPETPPPPSASEAPAPASGDVWGNLLQAGMALLQQFAPKPNGAARSDGVKPMVERDARTGETFVRLPVPPPEVLEQALTALSGLLEGLRGK
jgi:hypothetical protein